MKKEGEIDSSRFIRTYKRATAIVACRIDWLAIDAHCSHVFSFLDEPNRNAAPEIIPAVRISGREKNLHANRDIIATLPIVLRCLHVTVTQRMLCGNFNHLRVGGAQFDLRYARAGMRHRKPPEILGQELVDVFHVLADKICVANGFVAKRMVLGDCKLGIKPSPSGCAYLNQDEKSSGECHCTLPQHQGSEPNQSARLYLNHSIPKSGVLPDRFRETGTD